MCLPELTITESSIIPTYLLQKHDKFWSSILNTCICIKLITKLSNLGISTSVCGRILDVLNDNLLRQLNAGHYPNPEY